MGEDKLYGLDQLILLNNLEWPCWIHSCELQKNIWANNAALAVLSRCAEIAYHTLGNFVNQDFSQRPDGLPTYQYERYLVQNELIKDEVELGGGRLKFDAFGHWMLPGFHTQKLNGEMKVVCSRIRLRLVGEVQNCTLLQAHTVPHEQESSIVVKTWGWSNSLDPTLSPDNFTKADILDIVDNIEHDGRVDRSSLGLLRSFIEKAEIVNQAAAESAVAGKHLDKDVGRNLLQLLGGPALTRKESAMNSMHVESQAQTLSREGSWQQLSASELDQQNLVIPAGMLLEVEKILGTADSWKFDAFELYKATEGHPLSALTFWLLQSCGVVKDFDLDQMSLSRFLRRVEEGYPQNPYHNSTHAADVVQGLHILMTKGGLARSAGGSMCLLCGYIAGAVHDFEHRGFNNDFLIRTQDEIALAYNDISPMENHHISSSFRLAANTEYNFWKSVPNAKMARIRKILIDMILATDMKQHFSILAKFQARFQVKLRTSPSSTEVLMVKQDEEQEAMILQDDSDRSLVLQVALKAADIGHITAGWATHMRWVGLLEEEFFKQGDAEKRNGLRVSPLMNREQNGITKSQVGFIDIVALPLFETFSTVFPHSSPMLEGARANYQLWKEIENQKSI